MTKQETYNLIYSLHAAIENANDDNIDLTDALKEAAIEARYAKYDLPGLLNAGLFGMDCLKRQLEIIACLLVDNDIEKDPELDGYYDTEAETLICERCAEIAELSCKIASIKTDLNNAMRTLSKLDKSIFKK